MRLSLSALEPEPEPEPVQPKEERPERRADQPRGERPERGEGKGRKGKRSKTQKESAGYIEEEAMYNPFAEAFKGTDWEKE